jgi:hypothetical protein
MQFSRKPLSYVGRRLAKGSAEADMIWPDRQ